MAINIDEFWDVFAASSMDLALEKFLALDKNDQLSILEELQQKSATAEKPFLISVLRRKLHPGKKFEDYYAAWFPGSEYCNPVTCGSQVYQQNFAWPTRVINGIHLANKDEVIAVGFTWAKDAAAQKEISEYIGRVQRGEAEDDSSRGDKISQVADGELIGLYVAESDDNLGPPF